MIRIPWRALHVGILLGALGTAPAGAVVRTVGPTGSYATIQEAVDAAIAVGVYNEIRVAKGSYRENVTVPAAFALGIMDITGGWEPSFRVRSRDASETVVDGGGTGPVFKLAPSGGRLQIEGLTITNGLAEYVDGAPPPNKPTGAGVFAQPSGDARVFLVNNRITGNQALNRTPVYHFAHGGGIGASLMGSSTLELSRNRITGNLAVSSGTNNGVAVGGGVYVECRESTRLVLRDNRIEENGTRTANNQNTGSGLYVSLSNNASAVLHGNTVARNRAVLNGAGAAVGTGGALWTTSTGTLDARRNRWLENTADGISSGQVSLSTSGPGAVYFTDSLIAGGDSGGLGANSGLEGTLHLSNLTIVDNRGRGFVLRGEGLETTTLFNSILFGNRPDLGSVRGAPSIVSTLIGMDPGFRDRAGGDYRLAAGSPAIDAGTNPLVPRERLGVWDLDALDRVVNGVVDQGAYESAATPSGRETPCGVATTPGSPLPRWTPVCRCLSDRSAREFRCRLAHPDLTLELRFPLPFEIGRPLGLEWAAFPQGEVEQLQLEVKLPPGIQAPGQKPPYVLKLKGPPGGLAQAKLAVRPVEDLDAYPLAVRVEAAVAGPDDQPIGLELLMPLEAALEKDGEMQQEAAEQIERTPGGG